MAVVECAPAVAGPIDWLRGPRFDLSLIVGVLALALVLGAAGAPRRRCSPRSSRSTSGCWPIRTRCRRSRGSRSTARARGPTRSCCSGCRRWCSPPLPGRWRSAGCWRSIRSTSCGSRGTTPGRATGSPAPTTAARGSIRPAIASAIWWCSPGRCGACCTARTSSRPSSTAGRSGCRRCRSRWW
ncbi:hypothetical protein [Nannocystis pusilla]|uniref:hypothetical protein n=1 Tax=Nannocystis pusilla TaxID=889268 RepID=UPI003B7AB513